ncbi:MAG: hypothetical protein RIQ99_660 [Pseudomonadota bacterium]
MPFSLALIVPLMAQVGPGTALPQAPLEIHHRQRSSAPTANAAPPAPAGTRFADCLALARSDATAAVAEAERWRSGLTGSARAEPAHCLGLALSNLDRWSEAEAALREARDATPDPDRANRAMRGAMAGNAALAAGAAQRGLTALDLAQIDARAARLVPLSGEIAIDRARALVALGRVDEADAALAQARADAPNSPQGWLLSATLARRQGRLGEAQSEIEQAAKLLPTDPEIALEAGVIAILGGRDAAARKSWASVIAVAPASQFAKTAQSYLDQLGPTPAPSPP